MKLNFSQIREQQEESLENAAEYIGVSKETLLYIEEKPSEMNIRDAVMLAKFYDVDIKFIDFT